VFEEGKMDRPLSYIEYKNKYLLNLQTNSHWSFITFKYLIPQTLAMISGLIKKTSIGLNVWSGNYLELILKN
jgi:hypothetical protein